MKMGAQPDNDEVGRSDSTVERVADISKFLALILGICYVLGLLIVNVDLGTYGVFSLGLDRPEYVLAGALWVFLAIWPIILFRYWRTTVSIPASFRDIRSIGTLLASSSSFLFIFIYSLGVLSEYKLKILTLQGSMCVGEMILISWIFSFEYRSTFTPLREGSLQLLKSEPWAAYRAYRVGWATVTLLAFLGLYARYVYPFFPMRYGGGDHPKVELYLQRKLNVPWLSDGIPVSEDGLRIGPVRLLLETDDTFTITRAGGENDLPMASAAYALNKEDVIACEFKVVAKAPSAANRRTMVPSPTVTKTPNTASSRSPSTHSPSAVEVPKSTATH